MKIEKNILKGDGIDFIKSPNHGGKFTQEYPDTIVLHYTAGSSAESSIRTLCNPKYKASAHLVVGRNGSVSQLVPFDTVAWHAGRSTYEGRSGYNKFSIGIEIDNAGPLTKRGNGYAAWFGKIYPADEVIGAIHPNESQSKFWQCYTEEQIEKVYEICNLLCDTYEMKNILGHEEISPGRKTDPGPAFPLEQLRRHILIHDRDEEGPEEFELLDTTSNYGIVTANKLNIRSGPGTHMDKAGSPLEKGDKVEIVGENDGWYEVNVKTKGWVSKDYISVYY